MQALSLKSIDSVNFRINSQQKMCRTVCRLWKNNQFVVKKVNNIITAHTTIFK